VQTQSRLCLPRTGPGRAGAPLRRAAELMPECLQALDFLGVAYLKTGDPQSAAEQLQILKGLDPTFEGSLSKLLSTEKASGR
jgi:hypothetical protein